MTSTCERVRGRISAHVDGHLTAREQLLVDAHVRACPGCRDDLGSARALSLAFEEIPDRSVPGLAVKVRSEVLRRARRTRMQVRAGRAILALGACVLIGLVSFEHVHRPGVLDPPALANRDGGLITLQGSPKSSVTDDSEIREPRGQLPGEDPAAERAIRPRAVGGLRRVKSGPALSEWAHVRGVGVREPLGERPGSPGADFFRPGQKVEPASLRD